VKVWNKNAVYELGTVKKTYRQTSNNRTGTRPIFLPTCVSIFKTTNTSKTLA
jgi:hypothetical protein